MEFFDEILNYNVDSIYPSKAKLKSKLESDQKLRIYLGIDPSSPKIHLGNAIALRKLREFQVLGHKIILLIGDFTGMIGDPTDKAATRKPLTAEEVKTNSLTYKKQAEKILDFSGKNPAEIAYNSHWLSKLTFEEIIKLAAHFTVSQLLERDMFQKRLKENKPIGLHEFLYPLMQGYDSVSLSVDLEIGGTDQTFNMLVGRELVRQLNKKEKFVLTLPLLEGTDGRKMSKSLNNSIDLDMPAAEMFGKIMSLKDELILKYFAMCTDKNETEIKKLRQRLDKESPIILKKELAATVVELYHGPIEAKQAQEEFERVVQKGELPKEIEILEISREDLGTSVSFASLASLAGTVASTSEAVRLAQQGGLLFNQQRVTDARATIDDLAINKEYLIQSGKRRFKRIRIT